MNHDLDRYTGELNESTSADHIAAEHARAEVAIEARETVASRTLHSLCQPLAAMECNVELALGQKPSLEVQGLLRSALRSCRTAARTVSGFRRMVHPAAKFNQRKATDFRDLCEKALHRHLMACSADRLRSQRLLDRAREP